MQKNICQCVCTRSNKLTSCSHIYIYTVYILAIYIDKLSFQHHRIKFPASTHLQQTKKTVWELSAPVWPDRRRTGPGETVDFRTCIPKAIAHGHVAPWQTYRVEKKKQQLEVLFRNLKKNVLWIAKFSFRDYQSATDVRLFWRPGNLFF